MYGAQLTLARFETRVALANDIHFAATTHDLAIFVAGLGGFEGRQNFHVTTSLNFLGGVLTASTPKRRVLNKQGRGFYRIRIHHSTSYPTWNMLIDPT